jgi:L-cystine transport system permease protein
MELFSFRRLVEYFPLILAKLPLTLAIAGVSMTLGLILGTIAAVIRINKIPVLNQIVLTAVSFLRGAPIIVQLFVVYYGIPVLLGRLGINANRWDKFIFVNITYALNISAFLSEIIRSSIKSIDSGQWEAAFSVGLSSGQAFRRIIAPQALLTALPSFSVTILMLIKNTSLGFTIGLVDMVGTVRSIGVRTHHTFEGYIGAAFIFVAISLVLNRLFRLVESRIAAKIRPDGGVHGS